MTTISDIDSKNFEDTESDNNNDIIEDEINLDNNISNIFKISNNIFTDEMKTVEPTLRTNRISTKKLTKYERVRVIGERTNLLARGAKPMILNVDNLTPQEIAEEELKQKVIPFKIKRPLPDNTYEIWKLSELIF